MALPSTAWLTATATLGMAWPSAVMQSRTRSWADQPHEAARPTATPGIGPWSVAFCFAQAEQQQQQQLGADVVTMLGLTSSQ